MAKKTITLDLGLRDRLMLQTLLPKSGSFLNLQLAKSIKEKTDVSTKEIQDCGIKEKLDKQGKSLGVTWNKKGNKLNKTFTLYEVEVKLLNKQVDELDKAEKIPADMFDLCEKIRNLK